MLMTFRSGQQALEALQFDQRVVGGRPIQVTLKTPAWQKQVEDEMLLARSLSVTLANVTTNSLLGEDFSFSTMSFDMDGKGIISYQCLCLHDDYHCTTIHSSCLRSKSYACMHSYTLMWLA